VAAAAAVVQSEGRGGSGRELCRGGDWDGFCSQLNERAACSIMVGLTEVSNSTSGAASRWPDGNMHIAADKLVTAA
jgi:hypothetical protein